MTDTKTNIDPKGLIRDSYRIDGISLPECRSIFLDWAIGVPAGVNSKPLIEQFLLQYGKDAPDHPMTSVLKEGLSTPIIAKRRGGRRARVPY